MVVFLGVELLPEAGPRPDLEVHHLSLLCQPNRIAQVPPPEVVQVPHPGAARVQHPGVARVQHPGVALVLRRNREVRRINEAAIHQRRPPSTIVVSGISIRVFCYEFVIKGVFKSYLILTLCLNKLPTLRAIYLTYLFFSFLIH